MYPLRAKACKCSSAALADLKPSSLAISARVGGAPVWRMAASINERICCCLAVSLLCSITAPEVGENERLFLPFGYCLDIQ
jgi:hypothetical protein